MRLVTILRGALFAFAFAIISTAAWAAPPSAPIGLRGFLQTGQNAPPTIYLGWVAGSQSEDVTTFRVYVARPSGGAISFDQVGSVTTNDSIQFTGSYSFPVTQAGDYHFYVTAVNADGEGAPSDTITVGVQTISWITLTPTDVYDTVRVGSRWTQTFWAYASDSMAIRYELAPTAPEGMELMNDGVVAWTPAAPGRYVFTLRAYLESDTSIHATATVVLEARLGLSGFGMSFVHGDVMDELLLGEGFTYQGNATADDNAPIWYRLNGAPAGMTIDTASGAIDWTATRVGGFHFSLEAGRVGNDTARIAASFALLVRDTVQRFALSGRLFDPSFRPVSGSVRLYTVDTDSNGTASYTMAQDLPVRQGYFYLDNLNGNLSFILQGIPDDTTLSAAYYVAGELGALSWSEATVLTMGNAPGWDSVFFRLPRVDGDSGTNRYSGVVLGNEGRIREGKGSRLEGASPLKGALVVALDGTGDVSGWDLSGADGGFAIDGLGAGVYAIKVDHPGYVAWVGSVTFTEPDGMSHEGGSIGIDRIGAVSGVPVVSAASLSVAPNPTTDRIRLTFTADGGMATVEIRDAQGRSVARREVVTLEGGNLIELGTGGLAAGAYYVTLHAGDASTTMPFLVVR